MNFRRDKVVGNIQGKKVYFNGTIYYIKTNGMRLAIEYKGEEKC